MGYSQGKENCCVESEPETGKSRNDSTRKCSRSSSLVIRENSNKKIDSKVKIILEKMFWEMGLQCFVPELKIQRKTRERTQEQEKKEQKKKNVSKREAFEHNKAWLLAESSGVGGGGEGGHGEVTKDDPPSVHSSFRFSFGSQVEFDTLCLNSSCSTSSSAAAGATVLMLNLDTGLPDPQCKDLKWRRMESLERSISPVVNTLVRFSFAEVLSATRNFSKGRVLGRGALSCVFRGRVGFRRTSVAIKRLDKEDKESAKAFCRELMIASSLHHGHIVPLLGFCMDPEEGLFLVYKYVSGGSLEHHLHEKKRGGRTYSPLPWSARSKVAIGIAEAVAYLHNGTERCVVHRDIKPSNILLSSKKKPKLCDFGLATWTPAPSVPFLCKTVKGTFGYLAPEYFQHGKVSDKTDIYALGVVLLELITGRKPIETRRAPGDENLVLWAKPLLQQGESIKELLDPKPRIGSQSLKQITRMVEAAAACINSEESRRPSINQVIAILQGEESYCPSRNKSSFSGHGCILDCYTQSYNLQTKNDMTSHFALAMLGVSDLEDNEHLYCR